MDNFFIKRQGPDLLFCCVTLSSQSRNVQRKKIGGRREERQHINQYYMSLIYKLGTQAKRSLSSKTSHLAGRKYRSTLIIIQQALRNILTWVLRRRMNNEPYEPAYNNLRMAQCEYDIWFLFPVNLCVLIRRQQQQL